jgi:hypothetical protein
MAARKSRKSRRSGNTHVRLPSANVEWTKLPVNAHVVMGGASGKVYVATLPTGKKAVVTWSGARAVAAQRFLDARVRATIGTPSKRRSRDSRLSRRSGNVASAKLRVVYRSPTGSVVWAIPNSGLQIMWAGPGASLKIGKPLEARGSVSSIDHHTANGQYRTLRDAQAAVRAFLAAGA